MLTRPFVRTERSTAGLTFSVFCERCADLQGVHGRMELEDARPGVELFCDACFELVALVPCDLRPTSPCRDCGRPELVHLLDLGDGLCPECEDHPSRLP